MLARRGEFVDHRGDGGRIVRSDRGGELSSPRAEVGVRGGAGEVGERRELTEVRRVVQPDLGVVARRHIDGATGRRAVLSLRSLCSVCSVCRCGRVGLATARTRTEGRSQDQGAQSDESRHGPSALDDVPTSESGHRVARTRADCLRARGTACGPSSEGGRDRPGNASQPSRQNCAIRISQSPHSAFMATWSQ
jgi:hypothetical protein